MITEYTIELRMEKSIQRITQPICVRINENETQQIRAKLMYENSPYSVQCDSAELHLLRDDGTWSHMEASVSGASVTCTIKANQLGKTAQNACAYFFFQKGTKTETTESFQVRIERAAVDTEASDAFFDASMNRIATKWGAYEATAEAQEIARKDAESKRKDAEASRVQAEQSRVQTEQSRVNTEQARVQVEQARADAEQERVQAEQQRKDAESKRTTADQQRTQAESNRANAEQARVQAEQKRVQAENERQSNESTRTSAEQSRQSRFSEMLDAAQNVKFRILSSNEVDSEGKPTITGSSGIIYLVKAQQAQETQANHYNEWIYLEGRWELFGSTAPTAAAIEVADIDKLAQGTTIAGNRVLNATGLNALWSKLQARLQSVDTNANAAKQASAANASSIQALSSKQSTFEQQASNQLKALRTWAESTLESKMQERYNAGFKQGKQEGGEEYDDFLRNHTPLRLANILNITANNNKQALIKNLPPDGIREAINNNVNLVMDSIDLMNAGELLRRASFNRDEKIKIYNNISSQNMMKIIFHFNNAMSLNLADILPIILRRRTEPWVAAMASWTPKPSLATTLCKFLVTHSDAQQQWSSIEKFFDLTAQTIKDFFKLLGGYGNGEHPEIKSGSFSFDHEAMPLLLKMEKDKFIELHRIKFSTVNTYGWRDNKDYLLIDKEKQDCLDLDWNPWNLYGIYDLSKSRLKGATDDGDYKWQNDRRLFNNYMLHIKVGN